jgi:hypothetical protein
VGEAGVAGTAGWNLFGTNEHVRAIYSRVGFTLNGGDEALECTLGSGRPYEARMYTWHGMTAGTGSFVLSYRAASGGTDVQLETSYLVGYDAGKAAWLYVIDYIFDGTSRTYGWGYSSQQNGSLALRFGTTVNAGAWSMSNLSVRVNYAGNGQWDGTWTGYKAGKLVTLTSSITPGANGTYTFQNNIGGLLIYADSDADVVWQSDFFTLPYTNTEEDVRYQRLAYVGTWNDGSSVGYLPLGSLLASCSDITYFASMPFEHRAWCPSVTLSLNDTYDSLAGRWSLLHGILNGGTGNTPLGSFVLYGIVNHEDYGGEHPQRKWRMFSGRIVGNPVYDYVNMTCEFSAEGGLAAYVDRTFDVTKAPWSSRPCGTWGILAGEGTYTLHHLTRMPVPYTRLYPTGSTDNYLTVESVVHTGYSAEAGGHAAFTVSERGLPSGFHIGAAITAIDAWPTPEAALELRNNPRLLVEKLLGNVGLSMDTPSYWGTDYVGSSWSSWADQAVLTAIPPIRPNDKVIDVLNEVCVALGCFYTLNPLGGVVFYPALSGAYDTTVGGFFGQYLSPGQYTCEMTPRWSSVDVAYGCNPATGDGPLHSMTIDAGGAGQTSGVSSRFLGDPISALVAGARALREYEATLQRIQCSERLGASYYGLSDAAQYLANIGLRVGLLVDFPGAPVFGWGTYMIGVVSGASYSVADDFLEFTIQQVPAPWPWACWGSTVAYNTHSRWF